MASSCWRPLPWEYTAGPMAVLGTLPPGPAGADHSIVSGAPAGYLVGHDAASKDESVRVLPGQRQRWGEIPALVS